MRVARCLLSVLLAIVALETWGPRFGHAGTARFHAQEPAPSATPPSLNWAAIRPESGKRHASRWDNLTLLDHCYWLTANAVETGLGLLHPIEFRRVETRCQYRFRSPQGPKGWTSRILSLYVEVHADPANVREAEARLSQGLTGGGFQLFETGAPDLHVYVSRTGDYLYVFPENGITLWRLGYLEDSPENRTLYTTMPSRPGAPTRDLGRRFMQLLVDTYKDRL
jgi:hypothetical protein